MGTTRKEIGSKRTLCSLKMLKKTMIKVKKKETKKTKKERGCDYSYLKNNFSLSFFKITF